MYLVFLWILTSNRRAFGTSGSNSACTLYSSPGSWARGLDFLARSLLPRFINTFVIPHLRIFSYHFYFFIYHSSPFWFKLLIFCGSQFPDFYTFLHWQTCMLVGQNDKNLWFYTEGFCRFWSVGVLGRSCKRCISRNRWITYLHYFIGNVMHNWLGPFSKR